MSRMQLNQLLPLESQLSETLQRLNNGEAIADIVRSKDTTPAPQCRNALTATLAIVRAIAESFEIPATKADAIAREIVQQLEWSGLVAS